MCLNSTHPSLFLVGQSLSRIVFDQIRVSNARSMLLSTSGPGLLSCIATSAICALDDSVFKAIVAMGDVQIAFGYGRYSDTMKIRS